MYLYMYLYHICTYIGTHCIYIYIYIYLKGQCSARAKPVVISRTIEDTPAASGAAEVRLQQQQLCF